MLFTDYLLLIVYRCIFFTFYISFIIIIYTIIFNSYVTIAFIVINFIC